MKELLWTGTGHSELLFLKFFRRKDLNLQIYDVLIIGGGLSGSLSAIHLAQEGVRVCLIEKERTAHHKVCGEYLSEEACYYLKEVGFDFDFIDSPLIHEFAFHAPQRSIRQSLNRKARGISRYHLDQFLLDRAKELGVELHFGERVKSYKKEKSNYVIELAEKKLVAPLLLLATGKHDLSRNLKRKGRERDLVGFKMHLNLDPRLETDLRSSIELFSFSGGYGGLSPIEGDRFNLCFLLEANKLKEHKITNSWEDLKNYLEVNNSVLANRLRRSHSLLDRPVTISGVPYGHFLDQAPPSDGLFYLGDQAAVIPSFTGEGMSIALLSARMASDLIVQNNLNPESSKQYQDYLTRILRGRMNLAFPIHSLMRSSLANWAGLSLKILPGIVPYLFEKTRCPEAYYWRSMG